MKPHQIALTVFLFGLGIPTGSIAADPSPLKVFILVGQSNMQGHAQIRTFEHIGMDPKTAPLLEAMQGENGKPIVCDDVWISLLSTNGEKKGQLTAGFGANDEKIGPEFTFGIFTQEELGEPILIIKTAWGGKSLHTDFRPPSAAPYEFNDAQIARFVQQEKDVESIKAEKRQATGHYYRLTVEHVRKVLENLAEFYPDYRPEQGYELSGLVWFQGWNDMVDRGTYPNREEEGGYAQYSELLAQFIRDIRTDLSADNLPVVIGVMGVGGPVDLYPPEKRRHTKVHQNFRAAMAAPAKLPEFQGNVAAVLTEDYWDPQLSKLTARDAKIKQAVNQRRSKGGVSRDELPAMQKQLRSDEFTADELEILEKGISNFEFHYLGSAKIMAQIGRAFAQSLAQMNRD